MVIAYITGWDQSPKWDMIARLGYYCPNGILIPSDKNKKKIDFEIFYIRP